MTNSMIYSTVTQNYIVSCMRLKFSKPLIEPSKNCEPDKNNICSINLNLHCEVDCMDDSHPWLYNKEKQLKHQPLLPIPWTDLIHDLINLYAQWLMIILVRNHFWNGCLHHIWVLQSLFPFLHFLSVKYVQLLDDLSTMIPLIVISLFVSCVSRHNQSLAWSLPWTTIYFWLKGLQSYEGDCVMISFPHVYCFNMLLFFSFPFMYDCRYMHDTHGLVLHWLMIAVLTYHTDSCLTHGCAQTMSHSINTHSYLFGSLAYSCWNTITPLFLLLLRLSRVSVPSYNFEWL